MFATLTGNQGRLGASCDGRHVCANSEETPGGRGPIPGRLGRAHAREALRQHARGYALAEDEANSTVIIRAFSGVVRAKAGTLAVDTISFMPCMSLPTGQRTGQRDAGVGRCRNVGARSIA